MRILGSGILKKIGSMADGGIDYTISSSIPADNPLPLLQKPVTFLIQEGEKEITEEIGSAIKEAGLTAKVPEGKTPSQRLRGVLFVYWEQNMISKDFNKYYADKLEEFINHYKSKLE